MNVLAIYPCEELLFAGGGSESEPGREGVVVTVLGEPAYHAVLEVCRTMFNGSQSVWTAGGDNAHLLIMPDMTMRGFRKMERRIRKALADEYAANGDEPCNCTKCRAARGE